MEKIPRRSLFVCFANIDRSKTGEKVYGDMLGERGFAVGKLEQTVGSDFYVGSAGVKANEYGCRGYSVQYTSEIGDRAEIIFAADEIVLAELINIDPKNVSKVVNLEIPDVYDTEHEQDYRMLVALFRKKLVEYLPVKK